MATIILAAGSLCLLYFIVLLLKRVDFCIIWFLMGVFLLIVGGYLRQMAGHSQKPRLPVWALTVVGAVIVCALAVFLAVEGLIICAMLKKPEKNLDYVIVLGAQVKGTVPSRALRLRLEMAETYLKENPETIAVLSGGQGSGEEITEAQCMQEYLTEHGIEKSRLLMESNSTTTEENLNFSAAVIAQNAAASGEKGKSEIPVMQGSAGPDLGKRQRIGILSNNFHVYRASLLAEKMGYEHVSTIAAGSDWRLQAHYMVREFFALVKEKITGNI